MPTEEDRSWCQWWGNLEDRELLTSGREEKFRGKLNLSLVFLENLKRETTYRQWRHCLVLSLARKLRVVSVFLALLLGTYEDHILMLPWAVSPMLWQRKCEKCYETLQTEGLCDQPCSCLPAVRDEGCSSPGTWRTAWAAPSGHEIWAKYPPFRAYGPMAWVHFCRIM